MPRQAWKSEYQLATLISLTVQLILGSDDLCYEYWLPFVLICFAMDSIKAPDIDVLIVGAGIFGTSAAYHLSRSHPQPSKVTVIDRALVPSPLAASSDINKIVRADYSKPFYMDLAYEAMEAWSSWPILQPHFHQTGWVALDEKGSNLSQRIRHNFRQSGYPDTSADITLDEVKDKWGGVLSGIDTHGFDKAYTNTSAGWADASSAVKALMDESVKNGVNYEVGVVDKLLNDGRSLTGVRTTDGRTLIANRVVLATGAWTPWLMAELEQEMRISSRDSIQTQMQAAGVCVAAFQLSEEESLYYGRMPVLIYGSQGEVMPPNAARFLKFTNSNTFSNPKQHPKTKQFISVPEADQKYVPLSLKQQSIDIIQRRIPGILSDQRPVDDWRICWDAVSPDQNQLVCQHPDPRLSSLFFATAGSFHSWKFLPVIGQYVVNVLKGKSNGVEKDEAWSWKTSWSDSGAHEKVLPKGELGAFV
ncbi:hypothetical protein B0A52_06799 [Exophiala mesophila]|uniref:FAD dependent oxidoreductase domain-containing protein n=1 Tax=Exophiala mesophila TaxID=212818 RepID=A0A438N066_EXOME|nr:hypothetical protein B0A52_06799 [Exophiala mesophila]